MIPLDRPSLPERAGQYLTRKTSEIAEVVPAERRAQAEHAWATKSVVRFREIRAALERMASGVSRCMYCEDSKGTDIDHFAPKAVIPERAFDWTNYFLACSTCNSNYKRDAYPCGVDEQPLLLNPVDDRPADHWTFSPSTGRYESIDGSPRAEATIRVFAINRTDLTLGRNAAWAIFTAAIIVYAQARDAGNDEFAERMRRAAVLQSFAAVLEALLESAHSDDPGIPVPTECRDAVRRYPEIAAWLDDYREGAE